MKRALLILLALSLSFCAFAQPVPTETWTWQYGGPGFDRPLAMRPTPDGGVILAGDYCAVPDGQMDMIVAKLSADGETEWVTHYGDSVKMETAFDILPMQNGDY